VLSAITALERGGLPMRTIDELGLTREQKIAYQKLKEKLLDDSLSDEFKIKEFEDFKRYVLHDDWHIAFDEGNYDEALIQINKVVERNPNSADAYLHRAMTYFMKKDYGNVILDIQRVLDIEPNNEQAKQYFNFREIIDYQQQEKVKSLTVALRDYYEAHKTPDNEMLISVCNLLEAYHEALEFSRGCEEYGDREIQQLIRILKPVNPDEEKMWERVVQLSMFDLEGRKALKVEHERTLTEAINAFVDLGRRLLKTREMKAAGKSDREIEEYFKSWRIENVF
jgi:tetratricopeptide (TPR) repeat protein